MGVFDSAVTSILVLFVNMFNKARDENAKQAESEKKKLEKEAMKDKANPSSAKKDSADSERARFISPNKKQVRPMMKVGRTLEN